MSLPPRACWLVYRMAGTGVQPSPLFPWTLPPDKKLNFVPLGTPPHPPNKFERHRSGILLSRKPRPTAWRGTLFVNSVACEVRVTGSAGQDIINIVGGGVGSVYGGRGRSLEVWFLVGLQGPRGTIGPYGLSGP